MGAVDGGTERERPVPIEDGRVGGRRFGVGADVDGGVTRNTQASYIGELRRGSLLCVVSRGLMICHEASRGVTTRHVTSHHYTCPVVTCHEKS